MASCDMVSNTVTPVLAKIELVGFIRNHTF
jgi:hypothetical protein